jgi:predicted transcriptional regulator
MADRNVSLTTQEPDRGAAIQIQMLKSKLARASAQADRGEFVDPDEVLRKIEAMKRKRASNS